MKKEMAGPLFWFASGALSGALLSFFFDPAHGTRRRSLVVDKMSRAKSGAKRNASRVTRDLSNRAQRVFATYAPFRHKSADVDDDILNQRVRSQLGHLVDHAH